MTATPNASSNTGRNLEALTLFRVAGYDDDEMDNLMDIYNEVKRYIGFEDRRKDPRFIVKFHDVFYYAPDEYRHEHEDDFEALFSMFCESEYDAVLEELRNRGILPRMSRSCIYSSYIFTTQTIGHYKAFNPYIESITEDNAAQVAIDIYDAQGTRPYYVGDYVTTVKVLQDLEDNYMEDWLDFIDGAVPDDVLKQIKTKYNKDKEKTNGEQNTK